ncbi:MAG: tripartite tricarboxylate transporter substrate binding protein [Burkholderiaceae bacterium]
MSRSDFSVSRRKVSLALAASSLPLIAPRAFAQSGWKPTKPVKYIIPAGPGGSLDQAVRKIKDIAERKQMIDQPFVVENKPGGAGRIALSELERAPGDPHVLTVITYSLLASYIGGKLKTTYTDYQPIAMLFGEYTTVSVRADSPIKDAGDLIARLRAAPESLSLAVATSIGNHIHVGAAKPLKAAGVDISKLNVVPFKSSAESLTNLMGGHIDVMAATTPNVIAQKKAGNIRVLAIASAQRMKGDLADVPTWREVGVPSDYESAQGVMAPKGIPAEALAFWEEFFRTVSEDPEWAAFVQSRQWDPAFAGADATAKRLEEAFGQTRDVLSNLGLAKL